ncbi:hypothetical protein [Alishewanella sp. HL-SH06]|uniref:hypothetical protein n=1 Tax=Alishewanella sp. HL-SH06 TaxID=3461144 RepID=UPI004041C4F9
MIDKTENPDEIFLIEVFDGEDYTHVWSDTPAPGEGQREEDATRYVREDIYLAALAQVEQLKHELTLSTDQNDLLLDEFIRVKHLTNNTEIHQLCERAHIRMRQKVSVIERNHKMEIDISQLKSRIHELENSDDKALLKALIYAPSSPVSPAEAFKIKDWYGNFKKFRQQAKAGE